MPLARPTSPFRWPLPTDHRQRAAELLNHSLALATFTAAIQGTSDRLLQVSGLRVTYNPALSPGRGAAWRAGFRNLWRCVECGDVKESAFRTLNFFG